MSDLQRITTEYIPIEDRIRIVGKTANDSTITLWITRRLLQLLLPHLISWLKKRIARASVNTGAGDRSSIISEDSALTDVIQGFAQQAAIIAMGDQDPTPVRAGERDKEELIWKVDILSGESAVKIVFNPANVDEAGRQHFLTMEQEPLRQWLYILYNQSQVGDWAIGSWPEWITAKAGEESYIKVSRH